MTKTKEEKYEEAFNVAIELFDKYRSSFGLSDVDFPGENFQEKACEFEEKFIELICKVNGHKMIPDYCRRPEHDYCERCHLRRNELYE